MTHKITEDWLMELESKLHLTSTKTDRIGKRMEAISAALNGVCQKAHLVTTEDISIKKPLNFYEKLKGKLSVIAHNR
jgi:hypothetical protein